MILLFDALNLMYKYASNRSYYGQNKTPELDDHRKQHSVKTPVKSTQLDTEKKIKNSIPEFKRVPNAYEENSDSYKKLLKAKRDKQEETINYIK